jgi:hypothetical protein
MMYGLSPGGALLQRLDEASLLGLEKGPQKGKAGWLYLVGPGKKLVLVVLCSAIELRSLCFASLFIIVVEVLRSAIRYAHTSLRITLRYICLHVRATHSLCVPPLIRSAHIAAHTLVTTFQSYLLLAALRLLYIGRCAPCIVRYALSSPHYVLRNISLRSYLARSLASLNRYIVSLTMFATNRCAALALYWSLRSVYRSLRSLFSALRAAQYIATLISCSLSRFAQSLYCIAHDVRFIVRVRSLTTRSYIATLYIHECSLAPLCTPLVYSLRTVSLRSPACSVATLLIPCPYLFATLTLH